MKAKPKFKVGQVVRLDINFYQQGDRAHEQYQRIVKITPWGDSVFGGSCLRFLNGDACHEKWVKRLTKKEAAR